MVQRCRRFRGVESEELFEGRVRIVKQESHLTNCLAPIADNCQSLWRPLAHPIKDRPPAVCDGSTCNQTDLIKSGYVQRNDVQETMYLLHNGQKQWYYLSHQTADEVLLTKIYDSSETVQAISIGAAFMCSN